MTQTPEQVEPQEHPARDAAALETVPADAEQLDTEKLGRAITTLSAHIEAATGRLLSLVAEYDRRQGWAAEGFVSCAHWLGFYTNLTPGTARERVRVARALQKLPQINEAFGRGQLSYAKVRSMTRVATPDNETDLLVMARDATAAQLERIVRMTRRFTGDQEQEQARRLRRAQYWSTHTDDDGMLVVRGRLPPDIGAALQRALDRAQADLDPRAEEHPVESPLPVAGDEQGLTDLRVEALGLVARRALAGGAVDGEGEEVPRASLPLPLVVLQVDAGVLAAPAAPGASHLEDGPSVSAETSRRLACDASVVTVRGDARHSLDVGRTTRRISVKMARALRQRDPTCRFPGCHRTRYLQAHHIEHWASGGPTNMSNLLNLCTHHHVLVHEGGVRVEGTGEAPEFFDAQRRRLEASPPLPEVAHRPADWLVQANTHRGHDIDAVTGRPTWDGSPVAWGWAVEALVGRV